MPYKNKEKYNKWMKIYYDKNFKKSKVCPVCKKVFFSEYPHYKTCSKECREKYLKKVKEKERKRCREKQNNFRKQIRNEIFVLLGGKCANPFNLPHPDWCNDYRCLQIDHINGGGVKERKKYSVNKLYLHILAEIKVGSKDYQLLCANCQWIKVHENKEWLKR
jgi:hypothetical protein